MKKCILLVIVLLIPCYFFFCGRRSNPVESSNHAPFISEIVFARSDEVHNLGFKWGFKLTAIVFDQDGDSLTYEWSSLDSPEDSFPFSREVNPVFWGSNAPGEYTISCTVDDGDIEISKFIELTLKE